MEQINELIKESKLETEDTRFEFSSNFSDTEEFKQKISKIFESCESFEDSSFDPLNKIEGEFILKSIRDYKQKEGIFSDN